MRRRRGGTIRSCRRGLSRNGGGGEGGGYVEIDIRNLFVEDEIQHIDRQLRRDYKHSFTESEM